MRKDDQTIAEGGAVRERRRRYSLFYFEHVGSRSYLRITGFGLILILLFTIVVTITLLSLYLINRSTPLPDVNVTVKPIPATNTPAYPVIKQLPPPPAQKAIQIPLSQKTPPTFATPPSNSNAQ